MSKYIVDERGYVFHGKKLQKYKGERLEGALLCWIVVVVSLSTHGTLMFFCSLRKYRNIDVYKGLHAKT